jgi:hypothetical protein
MSIVELVVAGILAGLGVRSLVYWVRRPFASRDVSDHLLFALYLTGRVGLWFAAAGAFLLFASVKTRGRAFADDAGEYRWYLGVFLALAAMQLVAGWFLGHRGRDRPNEDTG